MLSASSSDQLPLDRFYHLSFHISRLSIASVSVQIALSLFAFGWIELWFNVQLHISETIFPASLLTGA